MHLIFAKVINLLFWFEGNVFSCLFWRGGKGFALQVASIFFYFQASKFCGFANALGWVLHLAKVVNAFNLKGLKYNTI
jgi:hypothetical protein